ncbi:MAG: hypothetical protein Q9220_006614 [cf. Caloplaca sp. 1 TL-2023]
MHALTCRTGSIVAHTTVVLPVRRILKHRYTNPHRSLHSSPRHLQLNYPPDVPEAARNHVADLPAQPLETVNGASSEAESLGGSGNDPEKPVKPVDKSNYGSASRRAGRNLRKLKEIPPFQLPNSFLLKNVILRERFDDKFGRHQSETNTGDFTPTTDLSLPQDESLLGVAARSAAKIPREPDIEFQQGSNPGIPGLGGSPWEDEIYSSVATGLRLPISAYAHSRISARPHLVLHYPVGRTYTFFHILLVNIASHNNADLIKIDAQDIAEIGGDYLDDPRDSQDESLSSLGYDVHAHQNRASQHPRQQSEEEDDEDKDEEDDVHPPRSMKLVPSHISTIPIDVRSMKPIKDLLKSIVPTSPNLQPQPFSPQVFQVMEAPVKDSTREMKLTTFLDALLQAADSKRAMGRTDKEKNSADDSSVDFSRKEDIGATSTSTQAELDHGLETSPATIVWVDDYPEIYHTSNGGKVMEVLHEIMRERRMAGQRILLVGTCSSDDQRLTYPRPGSKSGLWELDAGPTNTIIIPKHAHMAASEPDEREIKDRTKFINVRHLQDMIRRLTSNPKHTHAVVSREPAFVRLPGLNHQVYTPDTVHRVASMALGMMADGEDMTLEHIQRALLTMEKGDTVASLWVPGSIEKEKQSWPNRSIDAQRLNRRKLNREESRAKLRNQCNSYEKKLLSGVVDPDSIRTTFADVRASKETIESLKTLTSLSLERPDAFTYGVLATDKIPGLLLYGPPGTGKTLLAKAVAKECGATVLEVSGSDINDKYVGEGEKNVRAVFSLARKLTPCIVFIDEADAILGSRGDRNERVSHKELLNQFLKEWDGMNEMSTFIMVATNRPFDLDEATLRRLPRRMLVDLPTEEDREAILKIHLKDEILHSDVSLAKLAADTPLYSGSDLKNLAVAAALACVREEYDASKAASAVTVPTSEITSSGVQQASPKASSGSHPSPSSASSESEPASLSSSAEFTTTPSPSPSTDPPPTPSTPSTSPSSTTPTSNPTSPSSPTPTPPPNQPPPSPRKKTSPPPPRPKRILLPHHFSTAIAEISASVNEDMGSLTAIKKFDTKYGDRRGRKRKLGGGYGFGTLDEGEVGRREGRVRTVTATAERI